MEKLNIVGKRSGSGFVAHKATLVNALTRALADRVMLLDFTIGRKGLLSYIKALAGSNVVRVVPAKGSASEAQATVKRLKVNCGNHTSYLEDMAWVCEKTPLTYCEVRVSPNNTVKPNVGSLELAEALNRVLPFTATEDNRPVLQCVLFKAGEGKLKLVSADGFRLAVQSIDYDGEGQALISRNDLWGTINALRKARRVNISFEASGDSLDGTSLVIDTEAIRYSWKSADGSFPDYEKLIPTEEKSTIHFDALEAIKAVNTLKALADSKAYPIDLTLNDGMVILSSPDDKGQAVIPADIEGEPNKVRLDGKYLIQALRACGGMLDLSLSEPSRPVLFKVDGYQLVTMPMMVTDTKAAEEKAESEAQPQAQTEPQVEEAEPTEPEPQPQPEKKPKLKRKAREPVAV